MTAMPWGQKNNTNDMIHTRMVTPPLAAMDGITFKLKTATTNSSTRSRWPRTRFRCGWDSAMLASWVNDLLRKLSAESGCEGGKNRLLASLGMTTRANESCARQVRAQHAAP